MRIIIHIVVSGNPRKNEFALAAYSITNEKLESRRKRTAKRCLWFHTIFQHAPKFFVQAEYKMRDKTQSRATALGCFLGARVRAQGRKLVEGGKCDQEKFKRAEPQQQHDALEILVSGDLRERGHILYSSINLRIAALKFLSTRFKILI